MSGRTSDPRFALQRIDDHTWVITGAPARGSDTRAIAKITLTEDDDVEVRWAGDLPLPITYVSARDALESLEAWAGPRRATKPIPIPHFPPVPE